MKAYQVDLSFVLCACCRSSLVKYDDATLTVKSARKVQQLALLLCDVKLQKVKSEPMVA